MTRGSFSNYKNRDWDLPRKSDESIYHQGQLYGGGVSNSTQNIYHSEYGNVSNCKCKIGLL